MTQEVLYKRDLLRRERVSKYKPFLKLKGYELEAISRIDNGDKLNSSLVSSRHNITTFRGVDNTVHLYEDINYLRAY